MNIIKKINGVSEVKNYFISTSKSDAAVHILSLFQNFMACVME